MVVREGRILQLVRAFQCKGTRHHVITPPPRQSAVSCPAGTGKDIVSYAQSTIAVTSGRRWLGQERTPFVSYAQSTMAVISGRRWDRMRAHIVQELSESRGGRPGLSVLTSLLVSVDVKIY